MMVLLSTIAVNQQFSGSGLMMSVLKISFLLTGLLVVSFLFRHFLKEPKHLPNDEMPAYYFQLALCLMMVALLQMLDFRHGFRCFYNGINYCFPELQAEHIEHLVETG